MSRSNLTKYTCHGVTWATGTPTLLLADADTGQLEHLDLEGHTLGFKVTGTVRFCTGRYRFVDTYEVEPVPCPRQAMATGGDQCASCAAQDEFRFAHRFHQDGFGPVALQAYMAQPHWLYLATFAQATSKIGTAAGPRRTSRLNEQGPVRATYLVEVPDGRTVRHLEDTLSAHLGVAQTVRAAAKVASLITPDISAAETAHSRLVQRAVAYLTELGQTPVKQTWSPPDPGQILLQSNPQHQRAGYPHDLRNGEHGLSVESCLGTAALVRLAADRDPDTMRFVLDLNALKGVRLVLGDFFSPAAQTQASLF